MPLPAASSLRDRTPEFMAIVERLQRQGIGAAPTSSVTGPGAPSTSGRDPKAQVQQQSEFARRAADIGQGIHRVSLKLQRLAQLAKRTSMFDDPTTEVEELTGIIKQDIQALNASIVDLQRVSGKAQPDNRQTTQHSSTVVENLRARLKDATLEFKDVLTVRTDNLKQHKERRQLFSATTESETLPLLQRQRPGQAGPSNGAATSGGAPPPSFLAQGSQHMQLQLSAPQDQYLSGRQEALRNVESTIVELGTIFQKLSEMVAQQGEMAIRIDENVEETLTNVTEAQKQLVVFLNNISSNRWLILKVFAVLITFLVLFVMFIV